MQMSEGDRKIFIPPYSCWWRKNNKRSVELLKLFNFLLPFVSFCVFISIFMILTSFPRKNIWELQFLETISWGSIFLPKAFLFQNVRDSKSFKKARKSARRRIHWWNWCFLLPLQVAKTTKELKVKLENASKYRKFTKTALFETLQQKYPNLKGAHWIHPTCCGTRFSLSNWSTG